jgi:two-component system, chemotaxis family, CheB/CheR fusion protein
LSERDPKFEALLDFLRRSRGFDFTAYKRTSLMRRCLKRMQAVGAEDCDSYAGYLEAHPEEFELLFNTILINVTSFFRDKASWEHLAGEIVGPMLQDRSVAEPIRAWSAGCSSGEEAYSLAIVLAEALTSSLGEQQGLEVFRHFVKIYATDVDEHALQQARHATYPASALAPLSEDLRAKYFGHSRDKYTFRNDLRRCIVFGRHDLVQDPPISRLDLLVCRNTLMYFNAEAQRRILARFHFALNDTGYLFLGRAEMLLTHADLYTPADLGHRIFAKVPKRNVHERMVLLTQTGDELAVHQLSHYVRLREVALDASFSAELVVDRKGKLGLFNAQAESLFNLREQDVGRPIADLDLGRPPLELLALVDKAQTDRVPTTVQNVKRILPDGQAQYMHLRLVPLYDRDGLLQGTAVSVLDVTVQQQLREEMEEWRQRLETANEELLASNEELETTNEELQASNEELETTNEELHATIEELQTSNEELQSTTEEMETVNDELQSTNEKLQATNTALRHRTLDIERLNAFLESILAAIEVGVVVLDEELRVLLWNQVAAEQWGLRLDEVRHQPFLALNIGLPVEELREPLLRFLEASDEQPSLTLPALNRRGKAVQCTLRYQALYLDSPRTRSGVILFLDAQDRTDGNGKSHANH